MGRRRRLQQQLAGDKVGDGAEVASVGDDRATAENLNEMSQEALESFGSLDEYAYEDYSERRWRRDGDPDEEYRCALCSRLYASRVCVQLYHARLVWHGFEY